MAANTKKTEKEIQQDKTKKIMNIINIRCAYYRANPSRFCEEYLGIYGLRRFQKILLFCMCRYDKFYYIASRSQGKTFLVALFAVIRAILWPGELIVATSHTFKQGKDIILKITDDFMHRSPMLRSEISKVSTGLNDCGIWFKNGSSIVVKVANENTRGTRSTVLITDESRMVSQKIVDTVLRPMNVTRRPRYLDKKEYSHLKEMPKELYMSSAYYKASEMYEKVKSYTANFLDGKNFFVCSLPYMLSIQEDLMMREMIEQEMSEATFSEISFMMEREAMFYGASEDALFNYKVLNDRRILQDSFHNLEYYRDTNTPIPKKQVNEKRVLSLDIALLASKKHDNDASCWILTQNIQSSNDNYISNVIYMDTKEGLLTEELGLMTMRYFYQYDCDFLAIDANGVGQAVLDYIMNDRYDPQFNCTYKAMCCINNDDLNVRCKVRDANKVVYAMKATAKQNNDMTLALRSGFQNGYINLLMSENDIEDKWTKMIKGYTKLSDNQQAQLKVPYYQTTFLIDELINLDHEVSNGLIKVKERSGMRKDRYSSLCYNYYVVNQLKIKKKKTIPSQDLVDRLPFRKPKISTYH